MINYQYNSENAEKDTAVETFKQSKYSNHPNLTHLVPLNECIETLPRTKFRKSGKQNYSYFHCDKNSEHLLIIPQVPILHFKISSCGKIATISIEGTSAEHHLTLLQPDHSVYAFKGPISINKKTYHLDNAFIILLSDPDAGKGGNRSITGYDQ